MIEIVEQSAPHLVGGKWLMSHGSEFTSYNPCNGEAIWRGRSADEEIIDLAVKGANSAFEEWSDLALEKREQVLRRFANILEQRRETLKRIISLETGKPLRESDAEITAMINKVDLSVRAYHQRCRAFSTGEASVRFRPHGVVAVLSPFNFPGHLPNGHIVPALLAGNTVVFKPSDKTPLISEYVVQLWNDIGLPAGVLNLIQGKAETARALAVHEKVRGVFFTGSASAGLALHELLARHPEKILALEMGGNNPLVIHCPADFDAAIVLAVQSAFSTTGQRCTCARRLILTEEARTNDVLEGLVKMAQELCIGSPDETPEPFCGPLVSVQAADAFIEKQEQLRHLGAKVLLEGRLLRSGTGFVSPAIVDVTGVPGVPDEECFGPLLQVTRVSCLEDAIAEANRTVYGLVAGIVTKDVSDYECFRRCVRAGLINWNAPLIGASSAMPFGGLGISGNHRPSAFFAADYCSYPVVSIEHVS